jgi:hypothetical protein
MGAGAIEEDGECDVIMNAGCVDWVVFTKL